MQRRKFLQTTTALAAGTTLSASPLGGWGPAPASAPKFTYSLKADAIGVQGNPLELLDLAIKHGYTALSVDPTQLKGMTAAQRKDLKMKAGDNNIAWGSSGLPVQFRETQERFDKELDALKMQADQLETLGVDRVATWIMPGRNDLTFLDNMEMQSGRLRACAQVLNDRNQRLGLEYVGTPRFRNTFRYHFVSNSRELRQLIDEIDMNNMGIVMDSFHWYVSGDTLDDLRQWKKEEIIAVDLNDASGQLSREEQVDIQRELPTATGVIDIKPFIQLLTDVGYDGPVRAEPFNATLNAMNNDLACAATINSLKRAVAL